MRPVNVGCMSVDNGIAEAKSNAGWMPLAGKELKRLPSLLRGGERVVAMCPGRYSGGNGLVVATDARVLVLYSRFLRESSDELPYAKLSAVQWDGGFTQGKAVFSGSGIHVEVSNMGSGPGSRLVQAVRERIG